FYAGHLAVADSLDRLVLALTRKLNGERHPLVAEDLINLGAVQQEWGHYKEAEQYYRQALEIPQAFYGPNHYKTAAGLTVRGRAAVPGGDRNLRGESRSRAPEHRHCADQTGSHAAAPTPLRGSGARDARRVPDPDQAD